MCKFNGCVENEGATIIAMIGGSETDPDFRYMWS